MAALGAGVLGRALFASGLGTVAYGFSKATGEEKGDMSGLMENVRNVEQEKKQ